MVFPRSPLTASTGKALWFVLFTCGEYITLLLVVMTFHFLYPLFYLVVMAAFPPSTPAVDSLFRFGNYLLPHHSSNTTCSTNGRWQMAHHVLSLLPVR